MGNKVSIGTGNTEEFFGCLRTRARKLDRGEALAPTIIITFADPVDMLKVLTSERLRLLRVVKGGPAQVSTLALGLKRNVRAVSRDVSLLEKAGLVRTHYKVNPGHGRLKVVEPVASEYKLVADL